MRLCLLRLAAIYAGCMVLDMVFYRFIDATAFPGFHIGAFWLLVVHLIAVTILGVWGAIARRRDRSRSSN